MKKVCIVLITFILIIPINVLATPGALKSSTIKTCNNVLYGQHSSDNHWHIAIKNENGSYTASGEAIYNDPCELLDNNEKVDTQILNNDSTLKEIKIDGEIIKISDAMEYKTVKENVNIEINATSDLSKVSYNEIDTLVFGNNIINITVTSQDGTVSKYTLIIVKENELSNDTSIDLKIDGESVNFDNFLYSMEVKNNVDNLDIDYTLGNVNSTAEILGNENFVVGKNEVKIIVTAQNGELQEYIINVIKLDWINSLIKIVLGSTVVVTIVTIVKKIIK